MDSIEYLTHDELRAHVRLQQAQLAQQQTLLTEQQATIERLTARIQELERRLDQGGPRGMPGTKRTPAPKTPRPRKKRDRGFGRARSTPTETVDHALDTCPDCGTSLGGGSVKRTREVIDITPTPARVIEHRFLERECPLCRKRFTPRVDLRGQVRGRQQLGIGLLSLIVLLREVGRLPVRTIQWFLETFYQLHLSVGAISTASPQVATAAEPTVRAIRDQIRASPAVHSDESGWRVAGHNGYLWALSTATLRYFAHGRRTNEMIDSILGADYPGTLICDFYGAYNHFLGYKQRCWAHLLREIHELTVIFPADAAVQTWAEDVHRVFLDARDTVYASQEQRNTAAGDYRQRLLALAAPYSEDPDAPARRLSRRIERFIGELFIFVLEPAVPPTNNAAERSVRPLVIRRKISGGSRSDAGADATMTLASLFGTWQLQERDLYSNCRQLLAQP